MPQFPDDFAIVIIHLHNRLDRLPLLEHIQAVLGTGEIIEGYSTATMPSKVHAGIHDQKWAVTSSKIKALQYSLATDKDYILLIEDDCCFVEGNKTIDLFNNALKTAFDFDIMYGGWLVPVMSAIKTSSPCFQYRESSTVVLNHCVLMRRAVAAAIIENLTDYDFMENSYKKRPTVIGMGSDVLISDMIHQYGWKCYLCHPQLARQMGGKSDNINSTFREYPAWHNMKDNTTIVTRNIPPPERVKWNFTNIDRNRLLASRQFKTNSEHSKHIIVKPQSITIPATCDNVIFATLCDYPNPEEMSAMIRETAEYCGVPLTFASWGQPFTCLYEKLPKMLTFFKALPDSIKYVFYTDCRDTVYAKPVDVILEDFNSTYTGGVLIQSGNVGVVRGYVSNNVTEKIAQKYTRYGYACSGCYCGEISEVIKLLERSIKLHEDIHSRNYNNPLAALYLNDPNSQNTIHKLNEHDEFMFQLIQTATDNNIQTDIYKKVSALFANDRPNIGHVSLEMRRNTPIESILSVGSAGILHSPKLSQNTVRWEDWVKSNILK